MNNHEKDEFLTIICKLHEVALRCNLSNDILMALAGTFTIAKYEFEKPYPWPVQVISTDEQYQKFFKENTSPIPINLYIQPKE